MHEAVCRKSNSCNSLLIRANRLPKALHLLRNPPLDIELHIPGPCYQPPSQNEAVSHSLTDHAMGACSCSDVLAPSAHHINTANNAEEKAQNRQHLIKAMSILVLACTGTRNQRPWCVDHQFLCPGCK